MKHIPTSHEERVKAAAIYTDDNDCRVIEETINGVEYALAGQIPRDEDGEIIQEKLDRVDSQLHPPPVQRHWSCRP